jgi:hypothetical protein
MDEAKYPKMFQKNKHNQSALLDIKTHEIVVIKALGLEQMIIHIKYRRRYHKWS